ncbi:MAG: hypothetical protein RBR53_06725 [Desulforegulaceae bacterium]|nr:hypothetical protein [Desulforegulaceae bacterium]
METLKELLERKNNSIKKNEKFFFVTDEELNKIEEISTKLDDGTKVYDPVELSNKAAALGYWCEGDYIEESSGYFFEKYKLTK